MGTTQINVVQVCDRRWIRSLVALFLVAGLIGVDAPAYAEGTIIGTFCCDSWRNIALDAAGNVYTLNEEDVQKTTPDGVSTIILDKRYGSEQDGGGGIGLDSAGNVYTVNVWSNNVSKITPDGVSTILGTVGTTQAFGHMAVDVAGNVWVHTYEVDESVKPKKWTHFIVRITADGVSTNLGEVPFVNDMAVDAAGNVYIPAMISKPKSPGDMDYVLKITPAGQRTKFSTGSRYSSSVVVDADGNIYTANQATTNISKITPAGRLRIYGKTGPAPVDIAVDAAGNVYTANFLAQNVSKITPAGVSTILGETVGPPDEIVASAAGDVYVLTGGFNDFDYFGNIFLFKRNAKKTTIICKKGNALKNVTALKPVCPKGWNTGIFTK